jgi:hypothetical protein
MLIIICRYGSTGLSAHYQHPSGRHLDSNICVLLSFGLCVPYYFNAITITALKASVKYFQKGVKDPAC